LLPRLVDHVDRVVDDDRPRTVIDADAQDADRVGPADQTAQVLQDPQVQFAALPLRRHLFELRPTKGLALSDRRDHAVLDRPVVHLRDDLLRDGPAGRPN
jgi:hypothetical protein